MLAFLPKANLDEFVEELLTSSAEAFVVDFRLNEYRDDVGEAISYTGADLVERIIKFRKDFPCFVLTSYDADAIQKVPDVNYVYAKEIIESDNPLGQVTFAEKVRVQIEHYQATIQSKTDKFHALLDASETRDLTEAEENELLELDSYLESALNDHLALPKEKKSQLAVGRIDELITSTTDLLRFLKGE